MAVGNSEAEPLWPDCLRSPRRRRLAGAKLVVSDAHEGLKAAVTKEFGRARLTRQPNPARAIALLHHAMGRDRAKRALPLQTPRHAPRKPPAHGAPHSGASPAVPRAIQPPSTVSTVPVT
ncbi:hypothetical protein GCM10010964_37410 [Caldovatus sediminis]|uniref:Transposase n=1 Tax=Caldovatus sediminis TaxID=2041189 RepID=A0A8J3ECH5_9PROT|nr:hypothetical protein GCM10010964_37410 [Caldovatus sediminis]